MKTFHRVSPMRGLDLSSPITDLREGYALRLDDWVCRQDGVHVRRGYNVASSVTGLVQSLHSYPGHLICTTPTAISDNGVSIATCTSGTWSGALISNPGGTHLIMVNGFDQPMHFNSTVWTSATITGVDATKLVQIITHQRRIFAVERDSLTVWYLGLEKSGGEAKPIYLDAQCRRGGSIAAISSLHTTGGRGREEQLVVVTTMGELIIYTGTNPDDPDKFSLSGTWNVAPPVSRNCFAGVGGELALLTTSGLWSVPGMLAVPDDEKPLKAISNKIGPALADQGHQVLDSAADNFALIQANGVQFIKSDTGGWTRWTGLPLATTWCEHEGALYFGTQDGRVCRYGANSDGPLS